MPLVTTKQMLLDAQAGNYAVGAFNVENMEMVMATGTLALSAAAFTFARKKSNPAYLTVDGVVCMITGDFNSSAASITAMTISIFSTLKAPTA